MSPTPKKKNLTVLRNSRYFNFYHSTPTKTLVPCNSTADNTAVWFLKKKKKKTPHICEKHWLFKEEKKKCVIMCSSVEHNGFWKPWAVKVTQHIPDNLKFLMKTNDHTLILYTQLCLVVILCLKLFLKIFFCRILSQEQNWESSIWCRKWDSLGSWLVPQ